MKKFSIFIVVLIISSGTFAQTKFNVPERTDAQKLDQVQRLCYNNIIAAINFSKSQGLTAIEYGEYEGKLFPWNKEKGFENWINGFLYMNAAVAGKVEIIDQSQNKITIGLSQIYPAFENQRKMMGVTYGEFLKWYETMFTEIFNYLDCSYTQANTEEGVEITIKKITHKQYSHALTASGK